MKLALFSLCAFTLAGCPPCPPGVFKPNPVYERQISHYRQNRDPANDPCYINMIAFSGSPSQLDYLIRKARFEGNLRQQLSCTGNATGTALGMAVEGNQTDNVRLLLDAGASPHDAGEDSETPLQKALESGNPQIIRLFRQHGKSSSGNPEQSQ